MMVPCRYAADYVVPHPVARALVWIEMLDELGGILLRFTPAVSQSLSATQRVQTACPLLCHWAYFWNQPLAQTSCLTAEPADTSSDCSAFNLSSCPFLGSGLASYALAPGSWLTLARPEMVPTVLPEIELVFATICSIPQLSKRLLHIDPRAQYSAAPPPSDSEFMS